jgi:two-component system OmpR family sensor kinase
MEEGLWHQELVLDVSKARQILRNLLNNALKYRKRRVDLRIEEGDRCLHLFVRDDGEGIPANYHERIFECYFQMDMHADHCVRGHGLGLAGVQVLLEDMGGEMSLESDVGKGAAFSVRIPL